ncbi:MULTISPECIES: alcohol dehydrogenase catalytic domain-containing protein [Saccharopolyspora]|uniref:alcohol dehydrogenase catalytic domain-containing protein n=1 Tax=Saccharopolyspora TaxID=1835 RepID=UPI001CD6AE9C|nr:MULTISPECIES: alcohol dehydrogenase catalytic domain-containing protein [Saccharopolyspora]MCA1186021.1 alcohol dehydrogenase catalytic domain-containing protein [Saccharopolyspora sp. 6T]MCA1192401.1 alcohol dehydrogenase catalytic domain-containing protein [Saccharopolyspora sp. 6V]MCA1227771.1 alcohol dehydrogenase catalytic domain-containing protein [Saccharopolyspora sp. 6M]MCA1280042.1 alcohol dehydrogenase catalytic domain-containing protein [Saccharopolyspora sp. 7B]
MKVARFYAPGDIRIEQAPEPEPGPGELKLRVRNCSTCGTDLKIMRHGHHHIDPPRVIGHEIAGEVVGIGDGASGFAEGDRVQVIAAIPCGECGYCERGRQTVCPNQRSMGYHFDGGFAEFLTVPEQVLRVDGVNLLPGGVDFAAASVAEPLACVLNGQELARVGPGDVVVVVGSGPIGCLHTRLARARGAAAVYLVELNAARLEQAAELVGPDAAILASATDPVAEVLRRTGGVGADVVITAAASGEAQEQALRMAARGGRISFFGGLPKDSPIIDCDSNAVHYRELTIVGANGSTPEHNRRALRLIASGDVPVHDLITHRLPLDGVLEAIRTVSTGDAIKVTIEQ